MKKISKIIIPLVAAIMLAILVLPAMTIKQAAGVTYPDDVWVAPPPVGNNSNDGTQASPFATIQWAIDHVNYDGTVHVAAGTYIEAIHISQPMNLEGAGAHSTVIDGGGFSAYNTVIEFGSLTAEELTISGFTIQNGYQDAVGGILIHSGHILHLNDCTVKDSVGLDAGGILNLGELFMHGCTVSGNAGSEGGGIQNRGSLYLCNCTINGNSASQNGGGIFNYVGAAMTLEYSTIGNNQATGAYSRGGGFSNWGQATFESTIVADNTAGDGTHNNGFTEPAQGGVTTSDGYNIDSENSCGFDQPTDLINTDPLFSSLQDNGGPTFTHALLHGSPAIDAGDNSGAPVTDQRGVPRPQGPAVDIGAFELAQASVDISTKTGTAYFSTLDGYITNLNALNPAQTNCGLPPDFYFPFGLFSFNVNGITPGSAVTIVIILPSNVPTDMQYWKCLNGEWVDCTSLLGSIDGDQVITLTITDGQLGDGDGQPNGQISDPGGLVMIVPGTAHPAVSPQLPRLLNAAQISVQFVSVNPQQAVANQPVTISTNVVNTGDQGGNLNVTLKINGQVEETRMVSVGPQASQPIKFTVSKAQPGTYAIDIGGQTGSFTIPASHGHKGAPANTGMIIFLVMAVMVLATVMALVFSRRSA